MSKIFSVFAIALLGAGCVSQSGWTPAVDYRGNPAYENVGRDQYECRQLAHQASGGTFQRTALGALVGGAVGAAGGAAIGAATGRPGTGAAIGAASGGFLGGAHEGLQSEASFKRAYIQCMQGRGHRVYSG